MDYCATISTRATPGRAAQAITQNLEQWWSTRIERSESGFTTHFSNSPVTFQCDADTSARTLRWTCTDAQMIMKDVEDAAEWVGTTRFGASTPSGTAAPFN